MIPHSLPTLGREELSAVSEVISSGCIAQGKKVEEFERQFSQFIGLRRTAAVNSGTSALHLALIALDVKAGDEVVVPDIVCTALLNAINYIGATPVIADINGDDYNLSYNDVKRRSTKKTKAIILPHMFGTPSRETERFKDMGIPVIEDCAQSVGGKIRGRNAGTIGDISIFSFYATKVFTTGEGGMLASDSDDLIDKVVNLREYDNKDDYTTRYNYKMTDIQGAMGIEQLKKLPEFISKRRRIAEYYHMVLNDLPVKLPMFSSEVEGIYYRYVICSDLAQELIGFLRSNGIGAAKPVFKQLHKFAGLQKGNYPVADNVWRDSVSLPIYPKLSDAEVEEIAKSTRFFFR
ncbi:MAG: DegT/DnrJ/EryC1/StrS aminotransferase family protein [Deltaproteobacteria bacterium]|nr:DegT/DnrJ/EryC1/StrS aminotransferase family protein [Deltaproteobacteria bacterium]